MTADPTPAPEAARPATAERPLTLAEQIDLAALGSCTCGVKSPDYHWHDAGCRWARLMVCADRAETQDAERDALEARLAAAEAHPALDQCRDLLRLNVEAVASLKGKLALAEAERDRLRAAVDRAEDMARQCWGDLQPPFGQAQANEAERWWDMAEALRAALASPAKEGEHD